MEPVVMLLEVELPPLPQERMYYWPLAHYRCIDKVVIEQKNGRSITHTGEELMEAAELCLGANQHRQHHPSSSSSSLHSTPIGSTPSPLDTPVSPDTPGIIAVAAPKGSTGADPCTSGLWRPTEAHKFEVPLLPVAFMHDDLARWEALKPLPRCHVREAYAMQEASLHAFFARVLKVHVTINRWEVFVQWSYASSTPSVEELQEAHNCLQQSPPVVVSVRHIPAHA